MNQAKERAIEYFNQGFNCAQSTLCALCRQVGLEERTAKAVAGGFGGGVRCGELCGAVSGAVMAVGMAFPYVDGNDEAARVHIAKLTKEVIRRFKEKYGRLRCTDLIQAASGKRHCREYISYCAALAEEMITGV